MRIFGRSGGLWGAVVFWCCGVLECGVLLLLHVRAAAWLHSCWLASPAWLRLASPDGACVVVLGVWVVGVAVFGCLAAGGGCLAAL